MRHRILLLLGAILAFGAHAAPQTKTLDNGLRVVVDVDHRAPVVVHQLWYKVGSVSEDNGISGISHVLEHMMFKGTEAHPSGEFSDIIARNGGRENAFTSREYTAYFQQIGVDRLELMMELEADRMRNLQLNVEELRRELQVVLEERRSRVEDRPRSQLFEHFMATAYLSSSERLPVIGWPEDIKALEVEDLEQWYARWYAPNNAVLVVVGDVDPEAVFKLAEQHYGPIKAGKPTTLKARPEVAQRGMRRIEMRLPAKLPYLVMGFKTPSLGTLDNPDEAYALEVLAGILDGGASARFTRNIVRGRKLAAGAGVGYSMDKTGDALFLVDGTPLPGTSVSDLEAALFEELDAIKRDGVEASELDRVKAQVIANDVFQKDAMFARAQIIGRLEIMGFGHEVAAAYVERIQAVTADQVQAVARKYLVKDRLTVGVLIPESPPGDATAPDASEGGQNDA
ncbi:MAG TPA: peptidase M16 [Gammaproteobacteria bacterium]|jgi:zinc protease|nr:peptidase M16 [Gammaproteobacteria bacterium]